MHGFAYRMLSRTCPTESFLFTFCQITTQWKTCAPWFSSCSLQARMTSYWDWERRVESRISAAVSIFNYRGH